MRDAEKILDKTTYFVLLFILTSSLSAINFQEVYRTNPGDTNKYIYMVKDNVYPFLAAPLETLAMLTHNQQGHTVVVYSCDDNLPPDSSRNFLKNQYLADTLDGLKLAWMIGMRTNKEFEARSSGQYVQGPSDHYYRALLAVPIDTLIWNDSIGNFVPGSNGVIDGWGGDKTAKIGFGRIGGGDLTINVPPESILLKNYIQKDIQHRRALSQESTWGLFFADPATGDTGYCRQAMQPFFPVYVDTNLNVPGFIQFLQRPDLKGVSIGTHGSSGGFVINGEQVVGSQMVDINPKPDIQVINSCDGCKFSDPNNVGNYMNLASTHGGLVVIGYSGSAPTPLILTESAFWPTIDSGTVSQAVNAQVNYYANGPWAYNSERDFFLLLGEPAFISGQFPHGIEEQVYEVRKPGKLYTVQPSIITNGNLLVTATTPGEALVKVFSSNGQLYKRVKLSLDEKTETVNVSDFPTGIYFVQFNQKGNSETNKVIITR